MVPLGYPSDGALESMGISTGHFVAAGGQLIGFPFDALLKTDPDPGGGNVGLGNATDEAENVASLILLDRRSFVSMISLGPDNGKIVGVEAMFGGGELCNGFDESGGEDC